MDDRCTAISDLTEKSQDWMIKIIVIEKSNIFPAKDQGSLFQRFMFTNEKVKHLYYFLSLINCLYLLP